MIYFRSLTSKIPEASRSLATITRELASDNSLFDDSNFLDEDFIGLSNPDVNTIKNIEKENKPKQQDKRTNITKLTVTSSSSSIVLEVIL